MTAPTSSPTTAFAATGLSVCLGQTTVLHDITLALPVGRWTCIVGPNGAGKSSLLKALAGLLPYRGDVALLGRPLANWPSRQRAQQLSWLGQNEGSVDDLTVWDVTMLGRLPHQHWLSAPNQADRLAVEGALRATQAWDWRARSLGQLSGGERQRVLLARALAVQAQVLLMDEPLTNLDPPHQADWLVLVQALVQAGKTVVSVLHELTIALHADELVLMAAGRVVHQGTCAHAATHRALEAVFDHRIAVYSLHGQWVVVPRPHGTVPTSHRTDIPATERALGHAPVPAEPDEQP